jgi:L-rhamnose mutarotase
VRRSCRLLRVLAGQEAEYDRRHREIWPELREQIDLTYTSFTVFRHGLDVVVYGEERDQPPPDGEVGERWRIYMADVLEPDVVELDEIVHFPTPGGAADI